MEVKKNIYINANDVTLYLGLMKEDTLTHAYYRKIKYANFITKTVDSKGVITEKLYRSRQFCIYKWIFFRTLLLFSIYLFAMNSTIHINTTNEELLCMSVSAHAM